MAKITKKQDSGKEGADKKDKYRVTNWSSYNKSLVGRGDITIWIDEEAVSNRHHEGPDQRGAQYVYSDVCVETILQLKAVFKLPYRQLQGFAKSIVKILGLKVEVPCCTQICRRAEGLDIDMSVPKSKAPIYIVMDPAGLKVHGEGEWKTRKHGIGKRRTPKNRGRPWRKLHLGVDEKAGIVHAHVLTENGKGDGGAQQVEEMLGKVEPPIDRFSGDGAYDTYEIWKLLKEKGIKGIIPPQENAIHWVDEFDELLDLDRNWILEDIVEVGREEWKISSNYHRRSLSETAMNRFKTIFGPGLYSRKFEKQKTEASIKVKCMNKMTMKGMPIWVQKRFVPYISW